MSLHSMDNFQKQVPKDDNIPPPKEVGAEEEGEKATFCSCGVACKSCQKNMTSCQEENGSN